ncbi:MAG TPA: SIR2 family protein, partial [Myxococcota bacterium]|nr:SIR2 family protein [Myxococcota bacterium]
PGLLAPVCGDSFAVARTLAAAHQFPLAAHEWDDLPRVSQFLSVTDSRYNVVRTYEERLVEEIRALHGSRLTPEELPPRGGPPPDLNRLLSRVGAQQRAENPADIHKLLAQLKASVYVTTNYDELLEEALRAAGRDPTLLNSRWRSGQSPEGPPETAPPEPREATPLVYHVFGLFGNDDSLVLTEDDYFDFLIGTAAEDLAPPEVEAALVDNALLFLGFRLTDWRFRVLFRLMRNLPGKDLMRRHCHVAVQMDPELQNMENVEGAREYLRRYFQSEAQIEIYFGSAEDFLTSLHAALAGTPGSLR